MLAFLPQFVFLNVVNFEDFFSDNKSKLGKNLRPFIVKLSMKVVNSNKYKHIFSELALGWTSL